MIGIETVVIMITTETEETVTNTIIEIEIKEIGNTAVAVADKKEGQGAAVVMAIQALGKKPTHRHIIIDPHQQETPRWQVTRLYQMVVVVTAEEDSIVEAECLVVDEEMTDESLKASYSGLLLEQKL